MKRLTGRAVWPHSAYLPDEDAILITGTHETPGLFQLCGGVYVVLAVLLVMWVSGGPLSLLTLFGYMITMIEGAWTPADNPRGWLSLALIILLWLGYSWIWRPLIIGPAGGHVWVKVTDANVALRSGGELLRIPREEAGEITKERHHLATEEARRQGKLARKLPVIYQDAFEIVMWYGEMRLVIAEMVWRDERKADALVLRLRRTIHDFEKEVESLTGRKRKTRRTAGTPESAGGSGGEYR